MNVPSSPRTLSSALRVYAVALTLCLAILTVTLKLWEADLRLPFNSRGDCLFTQLWIKGMIENGWYLHQERVGVPGGSDLYDYPMPDNIHFGTLWVLTRFSSDPAVVFNLFFLLSFPLVTVSALAVLRELRLDDACAVVTALLYTFLPYHFLRGLAGHIALMSYFVIPPIILVALWLSMNRTRDANQGFGETPAVKFGAGRWLVAILTCLILSSAGIYYAFFGCFLLGMAGLICLAHRDVRGLGIAGALILAVLLGVVVNLLPNFLYRAVHGFNPNAVVRTLPGPEIFGMKITQLVLPMSLHRVVWLARGKLAYNLALHPGSSDFGYLGVFGILGFLFLLGRLLFFPAKKSSDTVLDRLQIFNVAAILLATAGGFGMVGSVLAGPWIRCFERMSIVIAFLSLLAAGLVAARLMERVAWLNRSRAARIAVLGFILVGGIWEETGRRFVPEYALVRTGYTHDARFFSQIESAMPERAAIFQLPYVPFPENGLLHKMWDYDHFRGYIHSRTLRWSYGAIRGREGDAWQQHAASLPIAEMVRAVADAGFEGIYVDRFGYADNAVDVERQLAQFLGEAPVVSENGRLSFFRLPGARSPSERLSVSRGR